MSSKIRKLFQLLFHSQKGQSLVEIAIISPLAIMMLIGVFEVGWALRGYLVLVNANREATRFAIRPQYLDFSERDTGTVGYELVLTHTQSTIASQVNADFKQDAEFIVTHLVVDTGWPCDPENDIASCSCDDFVDPATNYNAAQNYTLDDKIIGPNTPGFEYYTYAQPTEALSNTLINYADEIAELTHKNNQFNCELLKKGGNPTDNNVIITEVFYDQPQLFGFPLISNPYTDPVPLYSHTAMRLARGTRSTTDNDLETIGPVCDAMPFTVYKDTVAWGTEDMLGQPVDIFNGQNDYGTPANNMGWLAWNPDESAGNNTPYLRKELRSSNIPLNDYTNARDDSDHELNVGDWVTSLPGDKAAVEASDSLVSALLGRRIRIPVWDQFDQGTGGDPNAYHIIGFAWVRIEAVGDINLPGKTVAATYLGDATNETCVYGSGSAGSGTGGNAAPVANDDSTSTVLVTPVSISVLGNDTDADGDTLSVTSVGSPANGLVVDNGDGTVTYTANVSFTGADSFTYTISDGNGGTDTATVTVTVNAAGGGNTAPIATNNSGSTNEGTAVTINVLSDDTDADGDTLTITSVGAASNGSVVDNGDGTVTYTPSGGFSGSDSFTYTISDGNGGTATATVTVTVTAVNTNPVATDDNGTTDTGVGVTINLIGNDTDADGDTLSVTSVGSASNGSVMDNGDGTATYTSSGGFTGSDSFTYTISDGNGGTATATVNITVNAVVLTMHVSNMDIWVTRHKTNGKKWYYRGRIEVIVAEASGNPVRGVDVQGTWSGAVSQNRSGTTNSSGITSPAIKSRKGSRYDKGPFTFCVTNLVKSGWTYDAGANSPGSGCATASY